MAYLGFSISLFIYLTLFILFMLYLIQAMFKKYSFANHILSLIFLHSMFTIFILVWALVVMNGGFNIELNQNMDYTLLSVFLLFFFILTEYIDFKVRKNAFKSPKISSKLYRFLLPIMTLCLFFIATIIFYFNCHYLLYLITW